MKLSVTINGKRCEADLRPGKTLLEFLRDEGCWGVKEGCESGECGACTVLVNGKAVNSCVMLALQTEGKEITSIEGIGDMASPHPLQEAFVETGAVQCGFCTPGMILSAYALLKANPSPGSDEIRKALDGNLCRCTGYKKPVEAVLLAAKRLSGKALQVRG